MRTLRAAGVGNLENSVEEPGPLFGRGQTTGLMATEHPITDGRHEAVAEIPQRPGDQPQQATRDRPGSRQQHQDPRDGPGPQPEFAVPQQHERIEAFADIPRQPFGRRRPLQGGKPQPPMAVLSQQEIHRVIAEPADAVKKHNGVLIRWLGELPSGVL